jgi:hypothetical protein
MTTSMSTSADLSLSMTPTKSLIGTYDINVVSFLATTGTYVTTDTINLEIVSSCRNYALIAPTINPKVYSVTDSPLVFQAPSVSYDPSDCDFDVAYSSYLISGDALPSIVSFDPSSRTYTVYSNDNTAACN